MKKIFDITFWVAFISTLMHYYIWELAKDSGDHELVKKAYNIMFLSGALVILSYFFMPSPPIPENDEEE